ncbi:hypothetical protein BDY19DRAFT_930958 [Irpex rosettiformis]|uniref:Uncharacterized protein n=1 Tax=Irpex rosettiformis TaxID=378272 RepID=A0ACB8UBH9_9APHY|nr:hypothetical protein BDY19DRAFT_930958 [Irpex rosettiformis]
MWPPSLGRLLGGALEVYAIVRCSVTHNNFACARGDKYSHITRSYLPSSPCRRPAGSNVRVNVHLCINHRLILKTSPSSVQE